MNILKYCVHYVKYIISNPEDHDKWDKREG